MCEDARLKFNSRLTSLYEKKPNNTYLINKFDYVNRIQRLSELEDPQTQRTSSDLKLLKNCCLVTDSSSNQLKLCKPNTNLAYVAMEDLYDILLGIHLQLNHAGRNCMQRYIRTRYCNISKDCVMVFLDTCKGCPRTKRMNGVTKRHAQLHGGNVEDESDDDIVDIVGASNTLVEAKKDQNNSNAHVLSTTPLIFASQKRMTKQRTENFSRGQIDLFDMTKTPDDKYHWFLRYTNCSTKQVCLKPIQTGGIDEIANVLVDIYCEHGAPVVLQSLNGRAFVQQVIVETNKIYPQCRQLHSELQGNAETDMILSQLCSTMKRFGTDAWSGLLRFLQFEINSTYRSDINNSPFQLTYNRSPSMGLRNSKLMDILYERSNSFDEFMEYLADAELMRLTAFTQQTPIVRQCDEFGFSNNYSPISTNGITTTSTISQIVCTPESLPHSSTSSNNSFYAQPTPNTSTLSQGNTYHSLTDTQPDTPTQTRAQPNAHFQVNSFDQSPAHHSPNNYYPSVTVAQILPSNEPIDIKDNDSMMVSQQNDEYSMLSNCFSEKVEPGSNELNC